MRPIICHPRWPVSLHQITYRLLPKTNSSQTKTPSSKLVPSGQGQWIRRSMNNVSLGQRIPIKNSNLGSPEEHIHLDSDQNTQHVVRLFEQLGSHLTSNYKCQGKSQLQRRDSITSGFPHSGSIAFNNSPQMLGRQNLPEPMAMRKRFFSNIRDAKQLTNFDNGHSFFIDNQSVFDDDSVSGISTNFTNMSDEKFEQTDILLRRPKNALHQQEILERIAKIWSNMNVIHQELNSGCPVSTSAENTTVSRFEVGGPYLTSSKILLSDQLEPSTESLRIPFYNRLGSKVENMTHFISSTIHDDVIETQNLKGLLTFPSPGFGAEYSSASDNNRREDVVRRHSDFELSHLGQIIDEL